jgi:4a-hydroxytetrahydrobiopterin dehydratase
MVFRRQAAKDGFRVQTVAKAAVIGAELARQEGEMELNRESCVPCTKGGPPMARDEARALLAAVPAWSLSEAADDAHVDTLHRRFSFPDFKAAMIFVNRMADVAELEGHHPDFSVHYRLVDVELSTHDVHGLSRNDFILAAKIDTIAEGAARRDS